VERLGWTLVHILACFALTALMAAPLVTFVLMRPSDAAPVSTHLTHRVPFAASTASIASPVLLMEGVSRAQSAKFLPLVVAIWLAGAIALWMRLITRHELTHNRRSGHIRTHRELCCDDVFTYALAPANRIARLLGQSRPAVIAIAILLAVTAYSMFGQSADAPRFAVASVKRGAEWTLEVPMGIGPRPGGRLTTTNAPLTILIQRAYGVEAYQVVGGPAWINSDGYNIEAKPETNTDQKQMWLMLQTLLADRFKLKLHRETRELPVYALTATKGGPKLPAPKGGACNETMPPPRCGETAACCPSLRSRHRQVRHRADHGGAKLTHGEIHRVSREDDWPGGNRSNRVHEKIRPSSGIRLRRCHRRTPASPQGK
jgi:hypothetical protein